MKFTEESGLMQLPNEILTKILGYMELKSLFQLTQVSKKMNDLILLNPKLNGKFTLRLKKKKLEREQNLNFIKEMIERGRKFQSIAIIGKVSSKFLTSISKDFQNEIKYLKLSDMRSTTGELIKLFNLMPNVEVIKMKKCNKYDVGVISASYPEFKNLKKLVVKDCDDFNELFDRANLINYSSNKNRYPDHILRCHNLKCLSIKGDLDVWKNFFSDETQRRIQFRLRSFEFFYTGNFYHNLNDDDVDYANFKSFFQIQTGLVNIHLIFPNIRKLQNFSLFTQSQILEKLSVVLDTAVLNFENSDLVCKNLKFLDIQSLIYKNRCNSKSLVHFVQSFERLEEFDLNSKITFNDDLAFPKLKYLKYVKLSDLCPTNLLKIKLDPALKNITIRLKIDTKFENLCKFFKKNPQIVYLSLYGYLDLKKISVVLEPLKDLKQLWIKLTTDYVEYGNSIEFHNDYNKLTLKYSSVQITLK